MSELRWHPLLETWVINATHRQERTYKPPAQYCPLCPTKPGTLPTEVPASTYEIVVFENKFPSLRPQAEPPGIDGTDLYPVAPAHGICEVVLYSPNHYGTLAQETVSHLRNLVEVWTDRFIELGKAPDIEYVLIFENRGDAVGVTLHHPHGQIYAFPYVPPIPERELASARRHFAQHGRCIFCDIVRQELEDGRRIIYEDDYFVAAVPFFARYPYEVHVLPRAHRPSLSDLTEAERWSLARTLKVVAMKYDLLWGFPLPYVMIMHQRPTDGKQYEFYHFHVEFYPLHRTKNRLKYLAGCETGAGTFIMDDSPESFAQRLQSVPVSFDEVSPPRGGRENPNDE